MRVLDPVARGVTRLFVDRLAVVPARAGALRQGCAPLPSAVRGAGAVRADRVLLRDVVEEARGQRRPELALLEAPARAGEIEPLLRAGHPHVADAALLLHLRRVVERAEMGEEALLHAGHEDDRVLQPLRRVQRGQRHRVRHLGVGVVDVGDERHLLQERAERRAALEFLVLCGDVAQLLDVLPAHLRVLLVAALEVLAVAGLREDRVEQPRHRLLVAGGAQAVDEGDEVAQREADVAAQLRQPRVRVPASDHRCDREQRSFERLRRPLDLLDGTVPDAATGDVDDAAERLCVRVVVHEAEVGKEVAHLAAVVEACAADDAVADPLLDAGLLDRPRLRVRAVHDREVAEGAPLLAAPTLDLEADEVALLVAVVELLHDDRLAVGVLGPERALAAVGGARDHGVSRAQDVARRAVVLLQQHHLRLGEITLEVEQVPQIRGAPGVDRLVRVADCGDVAVRARERLRQPVLHEVRVLELVDQHVPVALRVALAHVRVLVEEPQHLAEEVVEVDRGAAPQRRLVALVDAADDLFEVRARVAERAGGIAPLVLRRGDRREHRARREAARIDVERPLRLAHHGHLVVAIVDGEVVGQPDRLAVAAQDSRADGVEGAEGQLAGAGVEQPLDALAHLARGLVRERDREHAPRRDIPLAHEVRDAVGDHAGLPGAGAGKDEQRAARNLHGATLRLVQFLQHVWSDRHRPPRRPAGTRRRGGAFGRSGRSRAATVT